MSSSSSAMLPGHQNEGYMETATGRQQRSQDSSTNIRHPSGRILRKSCDRCHQQKLRCVGSKTSLDPCARCQRVGVECVYSVRSSKQPDKTASETQDHGGARSVTPAMSQRTSGLGAFEPDLLHVDDVFSNLPSPWDSMGVLPIADHVLPPTQSSSASILSMSTGGTFSSSSALGENAVGVPYGSGSPDPSTRLASVCQTLEAVFKKLMSGPANLSTHKYPIAEVFGAFEGFLRAMALEDAGAWPPSRGPHTPFDEYMDSKKASLAAQCYMLCVKIMVSLSEKMLQNLLTSPMPAQSSPLSLSTNESAQFAGAMGTTEVNFAHPDQNAFENIRVEDLYSGPVDSFEHALNSNINMLRVGSRLLGRMELLLKIPRDIPGGTVAFPNPAEQPPPDQQTKQSLTARLVGSTWEHETSIGRRCAATHFRRCRAAILGLAQSHI